MHMKVGNYRVFSKKKIIMVPRSGTGTFYKCILHRGTQRISRGSGKIPQTTKGHQTTNHKQYHVTLESTAKNMLPTKLKNQLLTHEPNYKLYHH